MSARRCRNCVLVDVVASSLLWPAHYGYTREMMRGRMEAARAAVESLSHDGNCEVHTDPERPWYVDPGVRCSCARGRALTQLEPLRAPDAPGGLPRLGLLSDRELVFVDELRGRVAGLVAHADRTERALARARDEGYSARREAERLQRRVWELEGELAARPRKGAPSR